MFSHSCFFFLSFSHRLFVFLSRFAAKLSLHVSEGLLWRSVIAVLPDEKKGHLQLWICLSSVLYRTWLRAAADRHLPPLCLPWKDFESVLQQTDTPCCAAATSNFCYIKQKNSDTKVINPGCGTEVLSVLQQL